MGSINVNVHTAFLCGMSLFLGAYWHLKFAIYTFLFLCTQTVFQGVSCVITFKKHDL